MIGFYHINYTNLIISRVRCRSASSRRGGWGGLYHLLAGYGPSQVFACLIEPLVLALSKREAPYSIGRTLDPAAVQAFGVAAQAAGFVPRLATGWRAFSPDRIPLGIPEA